MSPVNKMMLYFLLQFLKEIMKKGKRVRGTMMRYDGYNRYVSKKRGIENRNNCIDFFCTENNKKNSAQEKNNKPTIPSALTRDRIIPHGKIALKNADKRAILSSLNISRDIKKRGKTSNAPSNAIPIRDPNSLLPNTLEPNPEIYIGRTGG